MRTEEDWIKKLLREARIARQPTVTEAVAIRMTILLNGKASEAPLTANELANTAKALIADMATRTAPEVPLDDANRTH